MNNLNNEAMLPFLTAQIDGIGGIIKMYEDDFVVEEMPLYDMDGQGNHIYALIEKKGIATMDVLGNIARALHITRKQIGFAGLKDARAIARQWISIENIEPKKLSGLKIARVKFLQIGRHSNKLRLGHLAGNMFVIRLRKIDYPAKQAIKTAEDIMSILTSKGTPNYFGTQRFGQRNDTHLLGEAIAKGNVEKFIDIFLGGDERQDSPTIVEARKFYEIGEYKQAHDAWPYVYADQRRVLKTLIKKKGSKKQAYHVVDKHLKAFFVSAYQSYLFNRVVAARMPDIDKVLIGDMAYKHLNGACFRVEDADAENPRCSSFEISPTGPLLGIRMTRLTGVAGDIENGIIDAAGLNERDLKQMSEYGASGARRPMRFQPRNTNVSAGQDRFGPYIELRFELDSGCYATSLIREISKTS